MKKVFLFIAVFFIVSMLTVSSYAALIIQEPVPGEFVVLDEDASLMWLQNANLAGTKNWDDAMTWADTLDYAGYNDWRLPTTPGITIGYVNEGEMGHLHYDEGITDSSQFPFINVQTYRYWLGTDFAPNLDQVWFTIFSDGYLDANYKSSLYYVWAVRDVASVPEPTSLLLLGTGLVGVIGLKRKEP